MRFLITGGSGFIGAHVARRLSTRGLTFVLARPGSDLHRLESCRGALTVVEADLGDAAGVRSAVTAARPDAVVHLAAAGVTPGVSPAEIVAANLLGTYHLLAALRDLTTVRCAVIAGSWYEYGPALMTDPRRVPAPSTPYGISKLASTLLAGEFAARGAVPCVVVRPFQVYGPDEPAHRLVPSVLEGARAGQPIVLQTPNARRDWVYVEDVARACEAAIDRGVPGGPPIDIGTGVVTSVGTVVQRVLALARMSAVAAAPRERPTPTGDAGLSGAADTHQAADRLGWTAGTPLEVGLRLTVQAFLERSGPRG